MERTHENLTRAATDRIRVFWNKEETLAENAKRINRMVNAEFARFLEMHENEEIGFTKYCEIIEVLHYMQDLLHGMAEASRVKKAA